MDLPPYVSPFPTYTDVGSLYLASYITKLFFLKKYNWGRYIAIVPKDEDGSGSRISFTIGPVTEHFANQATADTKGGNLVYGLAPTFEFVPAGYTLETVLVASIKGEEKVLSVKKMDATSLMEPSLKLSIPSGGVNAALTTFGDFLLARHNKTRAQGNHKQETELVTTLRKPLFFY